jgi:hypothetical protein
MVYVRLTKAEQAALIELAVANTRRVADEAGLAVAQHIQRHSAIQASHPNANTAPERAPAGAQQGEAASGSAR